MLLPCFAPDITKLLPLEPPLRHVVAPTQPAVEVPQRWIVAAVVNKAVWPAAGNVVLRLQSKAKKSRGDETTLRPVDASDDVEELEVVRCAEVARE